MPPHPPLEPLRALEPSAVEAFYEAHVDRLYAFVYDRVGREPTLAEDVVQETFCDALARIERFDPERGPAQSWLRTLSRNVIRTHLRERSRGVELIDRWDRIDAALAEAFDAIDSAPLSDEIIEREETREMVGVTISNLPEHYRDALEGKYLRGATLKELAHDLDLSSEAAAKSLLARARRAFRAAFQVLHTNLTEVPS